MTQRLPTAAARKGFASLLRHSAKGERIKLTRYNKTVAVIIPKKDLEDLEDCHRARAAEASADAKHAGKASRTPTGKHPKVEEKTEH
jgi:antitoxin (DNA-binding transcriptional repressor) of toxin-antitoxin stability system